MKLEAQILLATSTAQYDTRMLRTTHKSLWNKKELRIQLDV